MRRKYPRVCPYCKGGLGSSECSHCHGTGLMSRGSWTPKGAAGGPRRAETFVPIPPEPARAVIVKCPFCGAMLRTDRRLRTHLRRKCPKRRR